MSRLDKTWTFPGLEFPVNLLETFWTLPVSCLLEHQFCRTGVRLDVSCGVSGMFLEDSCEFTGLEFPVILLDVSCELAGH